VEAWRPPNVHFLLYNAQCSGRRNLWLRAISLYRAIIDSLDDVRHLREAESRDTIGNWRILSS
jgi:hypothetical protein